MRAVRSLPSGMRTIAPRSMAETLIWFGRLEVRIEPPVGVHARVQDQADVVGVGQDPVDEAPREAATGRPGPSCRRRGSCPSRDSDMLVCMPLPFTFRHRLRQEAGRQVHLRARPGGRSACRAGPGRRRPRPRSSRSSSRTARAPPRGGPSRSRSPSRAGPRPRCR